MQVGRLVSMVGEELSQASGLSFYPNSRLDDILLTCIKKKHCGQP